MNVSQLWLVPKSSQKNIRMTPYSMNQVQSTISPDRFFNKLKRKSTKILYENSVNTSLTQNTKSLKKVARKTIVSYNNKQGLFQSETKRTKRKHYTTSASNFNLMNLLIRRDKDTARTVRTPLSTQKTNQKEEKQSFFKNKKENQLVDKQQSTLQDRKKLNAKEQQMQKDQSRHQFYQRKMAHHIEMQTKVICFGKCRNSTQNFQKQQQAKRVEKKSFKSTELQRKHINISRSHTNYSQKKLFKKVIMTQTLKNSRHIQHQTPQANRPSSAYQSGITPWSRNSATQSMRDLWSCKRQNIKQ